MNFLSTIFSLVRESHPIRKNQRKYKWGTEEEAPAEGVPDSATIPIMGLVKDSKLVVTESKVRKSV